MSRHPDRNFLYLVVLRGTGRAATIVWMKLFRRLNRVVARLVTDESADLYFLAVAAFIFTILGVTGVSSLTDLAPIILALLAVLALSQIRSRRHVATIADAQRRDPFFLLATHFPPDLIERRAAASDLLLIGTTMSRTVQGSSREDMRQMLIRGGRIRVLLLDPSNDELVRAASMRSLGGLSPDRLKARVLGTLDELAGLGNSSGHLEIRVASFPPTIGMSVMDGEGADGVLVVQHNEYKPSREAAPIIRLERKDGFWFSHFLGEAERIWADGLPWPLGLARELARTPRPAFRETFGAELVQSMDRAKEIFITGVSRNTLLTSNYTKFEAWLRDGCQIRFLLIDPASDTAVSCAAERYYAERSPDFLRGRIKHSLKLLEELQNSTAGALSVRLTSYPLSMGIIAVDSSPDFRSAISAIFSEYYMYQAAGEPKFIMTAADAQWYENLLGEAEAFWENAAPGPA